MMAEGVGLGLLKCPGACSGDVYHGERARGDKCRAEFVANQGNLTGAEAAQCPANIIKMSVAPDGKSYPISVPSTGHSRTFKTKGTQIVSPCGEDDLSREPGTDPASRLSR